MIELVGKLAIIVRSGHGDPGINFVTPSENDLQFSILNHSAGHVIKAHIHKPRERILTSVQEVLYIEYGKMTVDLYDNEGRPVGSKLLTKGDVLILLSGGHGFSFTDNTRVIYTKQGPYYGREEDKRIL